MKDSQDKIRIIDIPVVRDPRGCLSFLQSLGQNAVLPFEIARVYWIYDIRGSHEHMGRALESTTEFVVALSGSCRVSLETRSGEKISTTLTRADRGLLIPPGTWRELTDIATNSVILVVCSTEYRPDEIIRDYSLWKSKN